MTPREADVFIDGYFVGTVDDFDGNLQRLHVDAGQHELTVYHEGYHPIREKVLFRRGATLKLQYQMQPARSWANRLPPRPTPDPNAGPAARTQRPRDASVSRRSAASGQYRTRSEGEFGTLSLRIQPRDAVVLVDGEEWDRPAGEDRFTIDLPEGPHRLEVRKDGFRTYMRTDRRSPRSNDHAERQPDVRWGGSRCGVIDPFQVSTGDQEVRSYCMAPDLQSVRQLLSLASAPPHRTNCASSRRSRKLHVLTRGQEIRSNRYQTYYS